jgi:hypothetical protein
MMFCDSQSSTMQYRLNKMREKGYRLVEGPHFVGGHVVLFHGTSLAAHNKILQTKTFKAGSRGKLGPGVYMSRDLKICRMFAVNGGKILRAELTPGMMKEVTGWDEHGAWAEGNKYHTAYLDQANSPRQPIPFEEWCITQYAVDKGCVVFHSIETYA